MRQHRSSSLRRVLSGIVAFAALSSVAFLVSASDLQAQDSDPLFSIVELQPLDEGNRVSVEQPRQWINSSGQVIGISTVEGRARAVIWNPEGEPSPLTDDGNVESFPVAINDRGEVAGYTIEQDPDAPARPIVRSFYWSSETGAVDIGTLGGRSTRAADINENGRIVGCSQINPENNRCLAATWTQQDGIKKLSNFGGRGGEAISVNDSGESIGTTDGRERSGIRPVAWDSDRSVKRLEGTYGKGSSARNYFVEGINARSQILGGEFARSGGETVFRYSLWNVEGERIARLAYPRGADDTTAEDFNDPGRSVGYAYFDKPDGTSVPRPVTWNSRGAVGYLEPLVSGDNKGYAYDINNRGQIVGTSGRSNTEVIWFGSESRPTDISDELPACDDFTELSELNEEGWMTTSCRRPSDGGTGVHLLKLNR